MVAELPADVARPELLEASALLVDLR